MYKLTLGSDMEKIYEELKRKMDEETANVDERKFWKQLGKTFRLLSENPRHPGLASHKIQGGKQYEDVWESYVENHTPGAKRILWTYEPDGSIWVHAVELHPENARDYQNILRKFNAERE